MSDPSVSVILNCYTRDRFAWIIDCLTTIMGQSSRPDEVIVVVDDNWELSVDLAMWLPEHWDMVEIVDTTTRRGNSGARNIGAQHATGDILLFTDDDAILSPGWIEALRSAFADSDVVAAGGPVRPLWECDRPTWWPPEFNWLVGANTIDEYSDREWVRNSYGSNLAIRRDAFEAVGGFNEAVGRVGSSQRQGHESEFALRLRQETGARWKWVAEAIVRHRVTADRVRLRALIRRCWMQGISKAIMAEQFGAVDSREREFFVTVIQQSVRNLGRLHFRIVLAMWLFATVVVAGFVFGRVSTIENTDFRDATPGVEDRETYIR